MIRLSSRSLVKCTVFVLALCTLLCLSYYHFNSTNDGQNLQRFGDRKSKYPMLLTNRYQEKEAVHHVDLIKPILFGNKTKQRSKVDAKEEILLKNTTKRILIWTPPWGSKMMPIEFLQSDFQVDKDLRVTMDSQMCGRCEIIYDRALYHESDAVIFFPYDINVNDLPGSRNPQQLFIWWMEESVNLWNRPIDRSNSFYNATMTFRRSSDVHSPYASLPWVMHMLWLKERDEDWMTRYSKLSQDRMMPPDFMEKLRHDLPDNNVSTIADPELRELVRRKDKIAVWIVSGAKEGEPNMLRLKYVKQMLKAGLRLDQFGRVSGNSFPIEKRFDPAFYAYIGTRYKFYLSFENCYHCIDYITEKVWYNALYSGAVPVIFGARREEISEVLPPRSYLHVDDFGTASDLVQYMNYLDKNITAYAEYLTWRTWLRFLNKNGYYDPNDSEISQKLSELDNEQRHVVDKYLSWKKKGFCLLCSKLHEPVDNFAVARHHDTWWQEAETPECTDLNLAKKMLGL